MSGAMEQRTTALHGFDVRVTSYSVGKKFACRVDNIDPGTVIGRSVADSRQEAEEQALRAAGLQLEIARSQLDLRESISQMRTLNRDSTPEEDN